MSERFDKSTVPGGTPRVSLRSEMQIGDPAVSAALETQRAEEALLALAAQTAEDELSEQFIAAEQRWEKAELVFADAVPTTAAGVMAKLQALHELLADSDNDGQSVERRHVSALIAYFKRMS